MSAAGNWIWYELLTSDVESAVEFYGDVVGWTPKPHVAVPGYYLFSAKDADIGGMMALAPEAGIGKPVWIGYIGVESVDNSVDALLKAGAQVCVPPTTYPGVGRFSMLRDPQGAPFYVMRPAAGAGLESRSFAAEVGHCQWNELLTSDPAAATTFYTHQLGWEKAEVMPMGPMGDYQFLVNRGLRFGALMKRADPQAPSLWRFYFGVDDIDRAARAIVAGGGSLKGEPQPVPGGGFAAAALDPQGAEFGIAGPRR